MKTNIIPQIMFLSLLTSTVMATPEKYIRPPISLEQEIYISDKTGLMNPNNIIRLKPRDNIKIYLPDGTELNGLVTKTEDINREIFKVFGDVQNHPNTGFGFVLTKDGIFAGAVVFRDTDITYKLEYSEEAKGYILIKNVKKKNLL